MAQLADQVFNLDPGSLFVVVFRTVVVYLVLWAMLRLAGKRELGQMSLFDLVVLLVISRRPERHGWARYITNRGATRRGHSSAHQLAR